jgi:hypothetical protein
MTLRESIAIYKAIANLQREILEDETIRQDIGNLYEKEVGIPL